MATADPPPEASATTACDQPSPVVQMAPSRNSPPLRPPPHEGSPYQPPTGKLHSPYAQDINCRTSPSPPYRPVPRDIDRRRSSSPHRWSSSYRPPGDIDRQRSPSPHRWSSSYRPPRDIDRRRSPSPHRWSSSYRPPESPYIKPRWPPNTSHSSHRTSSRTIPERQGAQPAHRHAPYSRRLYPNGPSSSHGLQAQAVSMGQHTLGFHPSPFIGANQRSHEQIRESRNPIINSHLLHTTGTSLGPSDARRNAAIQLLLSFFASSATNTIFSDPDVQITDPLPLAVPAHIRKCVRLKVPANTELRLRYWHLLDPTASVDNLLVRCLTKGLPYRVCIPSVPSLPTNSFFRDHALVVDTANLLEQGQTKSVTTPLVQSYFVNVQRLLRQPDAHKFLECGGLISRIARHYAPGLLALAFNGPRLDWRGTELDADGTHYTYNVRQAEIQTLLGLTTNSSSLWPSPDLYENSDKYNGEWTQANEAWFLKHAAKIQGCMQGCLRSGRDWRKAVRGHTDQQIASPTTIGTVAHARASCDKLTLEYPEFWSAFDHMSFTLY
jgi:hypothetical protein